MQNEPCSTHRTSVCFPLCVHCSIRARSSGELIFKWCFENECWLNTAAIQFLYRIVCAGKKILINHIIIANVCFIMPVCMRTRSLSLLFAHSLFCLFLSHLLVPSHFTQNTHARSPNKLDVKSWICYSNRVCAVCVCCFAHFSIATIKFVNTIQ